MNTAGGLVVNKNNDVLLIFRKGKWDLPKGKQEINESLKITAVREVEEETGINANFISSVTPLTVTPYTKYVDGIKQTRYANWYVMNYSNDCLDTTPQEEESIEIVRWVAVENLTEYQKNGRKYLAPVFDLFLKNHPQ